MGEVENDLRCRPVRGDAIRPAGGRRGLRNSDKLQLPFSAGIEAVKGSRQSEVIPVERDLPAIGKKVIVVCKQFRLLGYRDAKGVWREDRRPAEELRDVIGWNEL